MMISRKATRSHRGRAFRRSKVIGDKISKYSGILRQAALASPAHRPEPSDLKSGRFVLDGGQADGRSACQFGLLRELEWNDARNGSKNLNAAPSRRRPHACIDPRALRFARRAPSTSVNCWKPARSRRSRPAGRRSSSRRSRWWRRTSRSCARSTPNGHGRAFYELPRSIAMVAIARVEDGEDCVLPQKVPAARRTAA